MPLMKKASQLLWKPLKPPIHGMKMNACEYGLKSSGCLCQRYGTAALSTPKEIYIFSSTIRRIRRLYKSRLRWRGHPVKFLGQIVYLTYIFNTIHPIPCQIMAPD